MPAIVILESCPNLFQCGWEGGSHGYCVNSNGQDLSGIRHVYPYNDSTTHSAALCQEWCQSVPHANACEQTHVSHQVGNEGCYVHIGRSDPRGLFTLIFYFVFVFTFFDDQMLKVFYD